MSSNSQDSKKIYEVDTKVDVRESNYNELVDSEDEKLLPYAKLSELDKKIVDTKIRELITEYEKTIATVELEEKSDDKTNNNISNKTSVLYHNKMRVHVGKSIKEVKDNKIIFKIDIGNYSKEEMDDTFFGEFSDDGCFPLPTVITLTNNKEYLLTI